MVVSFLPFVLCRTFQELFKQPFVRYQFFKRNICNGNEKLDNNKAYIYYLIMMLFSLLKNWTLAIYYFHRYNSRKTYVQMGIT